MVVPVYTACVTVRQDRSFLIPVVTSEMGHSSSSYIRVVPAVLTELTLVAGLLIPAHLTSPGVHDVLLPIRNPKK